jgi:hypothetical protein
MLKRTLCVLVLALTASLALTAADTFDYKILATNRTGTMEKEMNDAASQGYLFAGMSGGETSFGGKETVCTMTRKTSDPEKARRTYKLLATQRTGTMQKELTALGNEGFRYVGQAIFETTFGGQEVVVILERNLEAPAKRIEYKVLATQRTGTLQKELKEAGAAGLQFAGMTVAKTSFGGKEVLVITYKED